MSVFPNEDRQLGGFYAWYYGNGDQSKTLSLEQDGFWQKNSKSEALKFLNDSLFTVYG